MSITKLLTEDDKISLAKELFDKLKNAGLNEWKKWVSYFSIKNFEQALILVQLLSSSNTLRENEKRSYKIIYEVNSYYRKTLESYDKSTLLEIFGYVSWLKAIEKKDKDGKLKNHHLLDRAKISR